MAQSDQPRRGGTRVVTRGGDTGETALGRGVRVAKSDARVEACVIDTRFSAEGYRPDEGPVWAPSV